MPHVTERLQHCARNFPNSSSPDFHALAAAASQSCCVAKVERSLRLAATSVLTSELLWGLEDAAGLTPFSVHLARRHLTGKRALAGPIPLPPSAPLRLVADSVHWLVLNLERPH